MRNKRNGCSRTETLTKKAEKRQCRANCQTLEIPRVLAMWPVLCARSAMAIPHYPLSLSGAGWLRRVSSRAPLPFLAAALPTVPCRNLSIAAGGGSAADVGVATTAAAAAATAAAAAAAAAATVAAPLARRGPFASVTPSDLAAFAAILGGTERVITDPAALAPLNTDWMNKYHGQSTVCLEPSSTQEVAALLAHCHARRLAVVPQGGNTGLVGGATPVFDEVILSLRRMRKVGLHWL